LPEKGDKIFIDPMQNLVNGFIADFDEECNEDNVLRFIVIEGKNLDIRQYVDYRILKHQTEQRVKLIETLTNLNPIVLLKQKGAYESVYLTKIDNDKVIEFYVPHKEYKGDLEQIHYATQIIDFLI